MLTSLHNKPSYNLKCSACISQFFTIVALMWLLLLGLSLLDPHDSMETDPIDHCLCRRCWGFHRRWWNPSLQANKIFEPGRTGVPSSLSTEISWETMRLHCVCSGSLTKSRSCWREHLAVSRVQSEIELIRIKEKRLTAAWRTRWPKTFVTRQNSSVDRIHDVTLWTLHQQRSFGCIVTVENKIAGVRQSYIRKDERVIIGETTH